MSLHSLLAKAAYFFFAIYWLFFPNLYSIIVAEPPAMRYIF